MQERLRLYRISKGLSQEQMAANLGVSPPTISRWETGKRTPRVQELLRIAEKTGIAAADLLDAAAADR